MTSIVDRCWGDKVTRSVAGEELGLSTREICSSLERGSSWTTELEETGGSTTRLKVVSSGRETVTLGGRSEVAKVLEWEESAEFSNWSTENRVEETEGLEAWGASGLGRLEIRELGLVVLGQLKGANKGSLKLEKVLGVGTVSKFWGIGLDRGFDKEGWRFLKSSMTAWKIRQNKKE
jgi:hypothetical protein